MKSFFENEYYEARDIPALEPVLQGWINAQRAYTREAPDDYPWYYRERSCIGFLAAGVWMSGGVALEEWATERGCEGQKSPGRSDLWISSGERYQFYIEAKHTWSNAVQDLGIQVAAIEAKLALAAAEARTLECPPENQLGVLFLAPSYPHGWHEDMHGQIAAWLEAIYSIPHSAIAWIFRDRQLLAPCEGNIGPGLVLLARRNT